MRILSSIAIFIILISIPVFAETFQFQGITDKVEIKEVFGNVLPVVKAAELPLLATSSLSSNQGSTTVNQYLRFGGATTSLTSPKVVYLESDDNEVGSFIKVDAGTSSTGAFFEYELEFVNGLESTISSSKNLEDIEDLKFKIFADEYTLVDTYLDKDASKITLTLATSAISHLAKEGEKVVYTLGANKYEIEVKTISGTQKEVLLNVNGQDIGSLKQDEFHFLSDDTIIGIRDVIISSGGTEDIADIFIGAKILEFEDKYNDDLFEQGVTSNKEKLSSGYVSIKGELSGDVFKLSSIKYRGTTDTEAFIPQGGRLSESLEDDLVLLGNWDILYDGFVEVAESPVIFDYPDSSYYQMTFQNNDGKNYKFPLYYKNGSLGDGTRATRIVEGSSSTDFQVALKDYIVLSSGTTKNDKSYVLQYDNIDIANKQLFFNEMLVGSTNKITATYAASTVSNVTGEGTVTVGGNAFKFYIQNASTYKLAIDLTKDGNVAGASPDIIVRGGGIFDPGTSQSPGASYIMQMTTSSSSFEEASSNEATTFTFSGGSSVGIAASSFTNVILYTQGGKKTGMSDYGAEFVLTAENSDNLAKLEINYPLTQRFADVKLELLSSSTETATTEVFTTCLDGIQNGDETGVDCGGSCQVCVPVTCLNSIQDLDEEGVDCGGNCPSACTDTSLGQSNQDKTIESVTQGDSECPSGCLYVDEEDKVICLKIGERTKQLYCAGSQELIELRKNGQACQANEECLSELCDNLVCGRNYNLGTSSLNIIFIILVILIIFRAHHALKT